MVMTMMMTLPSLIIVAVIITKCFRWATHCAKCLTCCILLILNAATTLVLLKEKPGLALLFLKPFSGSYFLKCKRQNPFDSLQSSINCPFPFPTHSLSDHPLWPPETSAAPQTWRLCTVCLRRKLLSQRASFIPVTFSGGLLRPVCLKLRFSFPHPPFFFHSLHSDIQYFTHWF